ncbi:monocarboxylate transporter 13-like [Ptychodera flava]|uniref:monocarboxylate transporter 13-like n=1 Tax=Ptychodera flava TaxID=63121 RepID=UPI00396A72F3
MEVEVVDKKPKSSGVSFSAQDVPDGGKATGTMDDTDNPPDWWKWIIVICNFLIVTFAVGLSHGIWLILDDLRLFYDDYNYHGDGGTDIKWTVYINIFFTFFFGLLAAGVANIGKNWPRFTVCCGAIISTLGLFVSWFATSAGVLCVTYGFVTGLGFGLMLTPSLGLIPRYFDRRGLDIALSLAYIGASICLFFVPPLFDFITEKYGKRATFVILACMNAQLAFISLAFLRPITRPDQSSNDNQAEDGYDDEIDGPTPASPREGRLTVFIRHIDLFLFQKPMFVTMVIAMFFIGAGHNVLILHLQQGAMERGADDSELQMLPIYYGIAMVIGCLFYGIFSLPSECCGCQDKESRNYTNKVRLLKFGVALAVVGLVGIFSFLATSFSGFIAVTIVIGLGSGFYLPLMVVMVKVFVHRGEGRQNHAKSRWRVTAALGFAFPAFGIGALVGLPVADILNERMDNYNSSYFLAGAALLLACIIVMIRGTATFLRDAGQRLRKSIRRKSVSSKYNNEDMPMEAQNQPQTVNILNVVHNETHIHTSGGEVNRVYAIEDTKDKRPAIQRTQSAPDYLVANQ